tara:strand:+ start:2279 stop:2560 length:282 start_codon:yes stop_codon:yes gene_type:complete
MNDESELLGTKPMLYADSIKSVSIIGSNARMQLEAIVDTVKNGEKNEFKKDVVGTIVMPASALDGLLNILEQLKSQIKEKKDAISKESSNLKN